MDMEMYWSQQEVFLMGTLALFSEKLIGESIIPHGEWGYYFNSEDYDSLAQQLKKCKEAGYLEFNEGLIKIMHLNGVDAAKIGTEPVSLTIEKVDTEKVTADLTKYLENWQNNNLSANAVRKPDDSEYQRRKLLTALKQAYLRQKNPHITLSDVYGDYFTKSYNYEPPFWEVILTPHFVSHEYVIRYMDYDQNGRGQPYAAIEITSPELQRLLKGGQLSEPIHTELAELKIINNIVHIRLESGEQYELKKFRTDSAPSNFMDYISVHPDTDIARATIQTKVECCTQKQDMTELVRHCGFTGKLLPLKDAFFAGTTEKKVHLASRASLTTEQVDLIKSNLNKSSLI